MKFFQFPVNIFYTVFVLFCRKYIIYNNKRYNLYQPSNIKNTI